MNKQKGIASMAVMIVMLIMAVALPVTTKLVQQTQENRSKAAEGEYYSYTCWKDALNGIEYVAGYKSSTDTAVTPINQCPLGCHNGACDVKGSNSDKMLYCGVGTGSNWIYRCTDIVGICTNTPIDGIGGWKKETECPLGCHDGACDIGGKSPSAPVAPAVKTCDGLPIGSRKCNSNKNGLLECKLDNSLGLSNSSWLPAGDCGSGKVCVPSGNTASCVVSNVISDPVVTTCTSANCQSPACSNAQTCAQTTGCFWVGGMCTNVAPTCTKTAGQQCMTGVSSCVNGAGTGTCSTGLCCKTAAPAGTCSSTNCGGCTASDSCTHNGCSWTPGINNTGTCSSVCKTFTYKNTGTAGCVGGKQAVTVATSSPFGCTGGSPLTSVYCNTDPVNPPVVNPTCTGTYHCVYSGVNNCKGYCIDACGKTDPSSVFDKCTSTVTKTCTELGGSCRGSSSCTNAETKIEGATPCSSGVCCKPLTCGNVNGQIPGSGDGGTACYGLTSGVTSCEGLSSADKYYDYKSALGTCNTTGAKCCTISKKTVVNSPVITVCSLNETRCTSDGKNVETCNSTRTGFITTKGCGNLGCNTKTKDCNTAPQPSTCLTACPNGRSTKEYCIGIRTEPVDGLDVNADKTGCTPLNCYHCDLSKCEKDATRCVNSVLQSCTKQVGEYWLWNDVSDCGLNNCITTNGVSSCKVKIDPPTDTLYCDNTIPYGCKEGTGRKAVNTRESDTMFEWDCFDNTRGISVPCSMKKCTLGDTRCDSDYIMQTCISGGIWGNKVPCTGDAKCTTYSANRGVCGVDNRPACEIRETKCVNGKLATCNSSRTGWNPGVVCPDASQECLDGYKVCTTKTGTNPTPINPPPTTCSRCSGSLAARGDATCDGKINESDFSAWLSEYQKGTKSKADFNCSGSVGIEDFSIWNTNFKP